jgi:hypothetical protein
MKPKRTTDAWGVDDVAQWARDALEYSSQPEFHRQATEAILELEREHGPTLGPVGLAGVVITAGMWELLDRFAPKGERCGVREQNVLAVAAVGVLLDCRLVLALAAGIVPIRPVPKPELEAAIGAWRAAWHRAYTDALAAVERGEATAFQQRVVDLVWCACGPHIGADRKDAVRLIAAMFGAVAQRRAGPEERREQLADVSTALYLAQTEKPARLSNTLFRKKDGKFTFSELGFRDVAGDRDRRKRKTVNVEGLAEELLDIQATSPLEAASQAEETRLVIEARTQVEMLRDEILSRRDVSPAQKLVANYAQALLEGTISARGLEESTGISRQSIGAELKKLLEQVQKRIGPKEL